MKTIRIGVATDEQIRSRVLDIAAGRIKPSAQEPKIWVRSVDEFRKLLSEKNMNLLAAIRSQKPKSVSELAQSIHEDQGNLTKRLKMLASFGLVELEEGDRTRGRTALVPKVKFDRIIPPTIDLDALSKAA
ncbi:transcriptional regulator [Pseudomonadota bacterium]